MKNLSIADHFNHDFVVFKKIKAVFPIDLPITCTHQGEIFLKGKAQSIQLIQRGDVIKIPADIKHWHGASRDSALTHIAITAVTPKGAVDWLERVTDEEFNSYSI